VTLAGDAMTDELTKKLGTRIRALRTRAGLSQAALAEQAGLSVDAVSRIERGRRSPHLGTLAALATGLEVPLAVLVDLDDALGNRVPLEGDLAVVVDLLRDQSAAVRVQALRLVEVLVDKP
jgi:transcriptional regulator with XRE-family HTH domain